jgi:hypothetical protein
MGAGAGIGMGKLGHGITGVMFAWLGISLYSSTEMRSSSCPSGWLRPSPEAS